MPNACNVMWRATQGCRKLLSSYYCSRPSVTLLHRPFFATLIMWLNFPAFSILWREALHMNADMNTHVRVTWRWGRMRSHVVKFSPFKNWERYKHVPNMNPCFHLILYNTATTYASCHRIRISPTFNTLNINHSNQRNHHYLRHKSPFIHGTEDKQTVQTYQHSKTWRVLSNNLRRVQYLPERHWNPQFRLVLANDFYNSTVTTGSIVFEFTFCFT
jgi:hypothetical protein